MRYEVELKFPLPDSGPVRERLAALNAHPGEPIEQRDLYFAHPVRDFASTDEALRLRSVGDENRITYKGPIVDSQTKTRQEIELPFASGRSTAESLQEMLTLLGFRPVRSVVKTRTPFSLNWENRPLELALDRVEGLGSFLEIEIMADDDDRHAARDVILNLAAHLGLQNPERRSYLCMLLEQNRR